MPEDLRGSGRHSCDYSDGEGVGSGGGIGRGWCKGGESVLQDDMKVDDDAGTDGGVEGSRRWSSRVPGHGFAEVPIVTSMLLRLTFVQLPGPSYFSFGAKLISLTPFLFHSLESPNNRVLGTWPQIRHTTWILQDEGSKCRVQDRAEGARIIE